MKTMDGTGTAGGITLQMTKQESLVRLGGWQLPYLASEAKYSAHGLCTDWTLSGRAVSLVTGYFRINEVGNMAKKTAPSVVGMIGEAVSDIVDAASVAATGSQLGVLELAAEDEIKPTPAKRKRKAKVARKKMKVGPKSKRKTKKGRSVRLPHR
jgi:hypothetical protein